MMTVGEQDVRMRPESGGVVEIGERRGLFVPWPLASLIVAVTIAIVGPTAAFMVSHNTLRTKLDSFAGSVERLSVSVSTLSKTLQEDQLQEHLDRGAFLEWSKGVDRRLEELEKLHSRGPGLSGPGP